MLCGLAHDLEALNVRPISFRRYHCATAWIAGCLFLAIGLTWPAVDALSYERDEEFHDYFRNWFVRSDKSKEEQPHWMTPIVTVTPRLEQEIREDFLWQPRPNGDYLTNYGGQKGLELIPTDDTEIIIGIPTYQMLRSSKKPFKEVGWADENLLLKYRFLTANEEHGNYIVTGFLGVTLPTGSEEFTKKQVIYTPTIAAGKGWGTRQAGFDIQSTLSASIPDGHEKAIGVPIVWNTALQPYGFKYFWPEVEFGYTYWMDGLTKKKTQWTITPGLILGRFPVWDRVKAVVGLGYQMPLTTFRTQEHTWILTIRFPF